MSKVINEIQNRSAKLRSLTGVEFCQQLASLKKDATEQEWIDAWNTDQGIIMGMINDMELACGWIDKQDFE